VGIGIPVFGDPLSPSPLGITRRSRPWRWPASRRCKLRSPAPTD